jgi:hypothetical protein
LSSPQPTNALRVRDQVFEVFDGRTGKLDPSHQLDGIPKRIALIGRWKPLRQTRCFDQPP